jgi:hypothetical protein
MKKIYTEKDIVCKWARKCDITKEGMDSGWCWGDGAFYTKYLVDTLFECREDRDNILFDIDSFDSYNLQDPDRYDEFKKAIDRVKRNEETDTDLLMIAYQTDYVYYTEWDAEGDVEDYYYAEMSDGNVIELSEIESEPTYFNLNK